MEANRFDLKPHHRHRRIRLVSATVLVAVLICLSFFLSRRFLDWQSYRRAERLVVNLLTTDLDAIAGLLDEVDENRRWMKPLLHACYEDAPVHSPRRLRVGLALHQLGETRLAELIEPLLTADPASLLVFREILGPHHQRIAEELWQVVEDADNRSSRRLRAACVLAGCGEPDSDRWKSNAEFLAFQLVAVAGIEPDQFESWAEGFRPVGAALLDELVALALDEDAVSSERLITTRYCMEFAVDDPVRLIDLLVLSDESQRELILDRLDPHGENIIQLGQSGWPAKPEATWNDSPLDVTVADADPGTVTAIETAGGLVQPRFAICQTLPLHEFPVVAESLKQAGYRPTRLRPYATDRDIQVAAVWTRDAQDWQMIHDASADEIRRRDATMREQGLQIIDVAGYAAPASNGDSDEPRFAALWTTPAGEDQETEFYVGLIEEDLGARVNEIKRLDLRPHTLNAVVTADGSRLHSGVWNEEGSGWSYNWRSNRASYEEALASGQIVVDVCLLYNSPPENTENRYRKELAEADLSLATDADDRSARLRRAVANYQLGNDQGSLKDLDWLIDKHPTLSTPYRIRATILARAGESTKAKADLDSFLERSTAASVNAYVTALVTAHLGRDREAVAQLDVALNPSEGGFTYDAACAYSIISGMLASRAPDRSRAYQKRALSLLERAITLGYRQFAHMETDPDLDPIRQHPRYRSLVPVEQTRLTYLYALNASNVWKAESVHGLAPGEHLEACRQLAEAGFRPVSVSVAADESTHALRAASVWHQPRVADDEMRLWTGRRAAVSALLARDGRIEEVVRLLQRDSDPRLRSSLIYILASLDTKDDALLERLQSETDASVRAGLLISLGDSSPERVNEEQRDAILPELLGMYQKDPDSEIHGAVKWLLRTWGQQERLTAADRQLAGKQRSESQRWYINGQGQTMILVDGPAEFSMGSPGTEAGRGSDELIHPRQIKSRFSLCDEEVTVEQFTRFLQDGPLFRLGDVFRDEDDGHFVQAGVNWYAAAAFCNWLSQVEGLPPSQWCYLPNESGEYGAGMRPAPGGFQRRGYRLPTEAEWEYACRAGTATAFSFGDEEDFLHDYGWFKENSGFHAKPPGLLKPNRWGLSDMHGNVSEWCHDPYGKYISVGAVPAAPDESAAVDEVTRVLRGGSYANLGSKVRSAVRTAITPGRRFAVNGFRVARTEPLESVQPDIRIRVEAFLDGDDKALSYDRGIAEWILALGGSVVVSNRGQRTQVAGGANDLPQDPFDLVEVRLDDNADLLESDLAHLAKLPKLTALRLWDTAITDQALDAILQLSRLRNLAVSSVYLTGHRLAELSSLPDLNTLRLGNPLPSDTHWETLGSKTSLRSLKIEGPKFNDENTRAVQRLTKLQRLEIMNTHVSPAPVGRLQGQLPGCSIIYDSSEFDQANRQTAEWALARGGVLDLRLFDGTTKHVEPNVPLPKGNFRIVGLNLDGDKTLTDADLVRLKHLTRLRRLSLNDTSLRGTSLSVVEGMPELAILSLAGTKVDDAVLQEISRAARLRKLQVWGTQITDNGLRHLKSLSHIAHLELGGNALTGAGLQHLSGLTRLEYLGIGRTQMDDESLAHLAEMHRLWRLHLSNGSITGTGLEQLKELRGLALVNLNGAASTPRGADLQRLLPRCNILHGSIPASERPDRRAALGLLQQGATVSVQVNWGPVVQVRDPADLPDEIVLVTAVVLSGADSDPAIDLGLLRDRRMLASVEIDGALLEDNVFGQLIECPRLSELHLRHVTLAAPHVEALKRLSELKNLILEEIDAPQEIVDAIQSALPGCHVRVLTQSNK